MTSENDVEEQTLVEEEVGSNDDIEIPPVDDVFAVIDLNIWIDTEDEYKARVIKDGFRYLLQLEFQKQQPLLAAFYELEFSDSVLYPGGSFHYVDKIIAKLKHTLLRDELRKLQRERDNEKLRLRREYGEDRREQIDYLRDEKIDEDLIEELRGLRKEVRNLRKSLNKRDLTKVIAFIAAVAPILQPISQATVDRVFPPIRSQIEKQLNQDHAPILIKINFKYLPHPNREM